jgi:hypothetical protein
MAHPDQRPGIDWGKEASLAFEGITFFSPDFIEALTHGSGREA